MYVAAGEPLFHGTCTIWIRAIDLNGSTPKRLAGPVPAEAKFEPAAVRPGEREKLAQRRGPRHQTT